MFSHIISIETPKETNNRHVNVRDMFNEQCFINRERRYTHGWDHGDIIEFAEIYCHKNGWRIDKNTKSFELCIPLIYGPKEFLLDRLSTDVTLGNIYQLELVLSDRLDKNIRGKFDLRPYITNPNIQTGDASLIFENDDSLPLLWLMLPKSSILTLRIAGAIRINSDVNMILQLEDD